MTVVMGVAEDSWLHFVAGHNRRHGNHQVLLRAGNAPLVLANLPNLRVKNSPLYLPLLSCL